MGQYIYMPKLDMSMQEGTIVSWLVDVGSAVKKGDFIAEIETGKVSIQVDATAEGTVLKLYHGEGDTVSVGGAILYLGETGESAPDMRDTPCARNTMEAFQTAPQKKEEHGKSIVISKNAAGVGVTLKEAAQRYLNYNVYQYEYTCKGGSGVITLILDSRWDELLGFSAEGAGASELACYALITIQAELCVSDVTGMLIPPGTYADIFRAACASCFR